MATEHDVMQAVREDQGPDLTRGGKLQINPAVVAEESLMARQIAEELRQPAPAPATFKLASPEAYLFRSDPGHRLVAVRIPGAPAARAEGHREWLQRVYDRRYPAAEKKKHAKLREAVGSLTLTFTPVPRKQECYYETSDKLVAGWLRELIAPDKDGRVALPHVYEDSPVRTLDEQTKPTHRAQAAMRLKLLGEQPEQAAVAAEG